MKTHSSLLLARRMFPLALALLLTESTQAQTILGSAGSYALMAGSTMTNNGVTTLNGDLGAAVWRASGLTTRPGSRSSRSRRKT
jgi:hypothetical protein